MNPEDVPTQLGLQIADFKCDRLNLIAGVILAAGSLIGGGIAAYFGCAVVIQSGGNLPFESPNKHDYRCWVFVIAVTFIFLILVIWGGYTAHKVWTNLGGGVILCEHGICVFESRTAKSIGWDQLDRVEEVATKEHLPLNFPANRLIPLGESTEYKLICVDGSIITIDGDKIANVRRFGKLLYELAQSADVHWILLKVT